MDSGILPPMHHFMFRLILGIYPGKAENSCSKYGLSITVEEKNCVIQIPNGLTATGANEITSHRLQRELNFFLGLKPAD